MGEPTRPSGLLETVNE